MQVQMANQMFPWSYGTPTVAEIAPLIVQRSQEIAEIVSERTLTPAEAEELEILAFAQVMFWTSSSVEQAKASEAAKQDSERQGCIPQSLAKDQRDVCPMADPVATP